MLIAIIDIIDIVLLIQILIKNVWQNYFDKDKYLAEQFYFYTDENDKDKY